MLETIAVILFLIWLWGVLTAHMLSGLIHVFLAAAVMVVVMTLVRILRGQRHM